MASTASSARSSCFMTTAMSLSALSTRSPTFIAFQNQTIEAVGSLSTSCGRKYILPSDQRNTTRDLGGCSLDVYKHGKTDFR